MINNKITKINAVIVRMTKVIAIKALKKNNITILI